jgi:hypothetical protein
MKQKSDRTGIPHDSFRPENALNWASPMDLECVIKYDFVDSQSAI